ncbi:MAG: phenylalanine--tRNA ligase subunit beta [Chloroflexi bacterium HGW-Chloroflexi-10]|nr:MAG: phenylalanine--tRNA ligase subunit beta [Chloroflexi bacterium HGW-Chloroflexi-10]
MQIPLSWLKDYIDIDLDLESLARTLTMVGLEVEEIQVVGLPMPVNNGRQEFKINGLAWDPEKFVVAQIDEVMPHPDADRLTLCRLNDGAQELVVLTGAPNLFPYKGIGPLAQPLKVAYAREGAVLYDGHKPGFEVTKLKRTKIRGVESFSMVCSEKELGISEEHEGIILLDADAPTGMSLADYMGDAVYSVSILPNMIRDASVIGVARELSAVTGKPLKMPQCTLAPGGGPIDGRAKIEITDPKLNPRFVVGLINGCEPKESPYWVQRRLRLAGMRPINSIVDSTNYVMLETGQPLHAFDYDVLVARAKGKTPTIITRAAAEGEILVTLDNLERKLDSNAILVCDTAGSLSLAGIMGGLESEVTANTRNVLLEGASWNFINVRRTSTVLHLNSEAGYRFARGVHPALSPWAVGLGMDRMAQWSGGLIAEGVVDNYPLPAADPLITLSVEDVRKKLGVVIPAQRIADILTRLEFVCQVRDDSVIAQTPPHRLDIGTGVVGKADLIEEVARIYSYNNIPETNLADELPVQRNNPELVLEERMKDILAGSGLQEVLTYRLTSPEREQRVLPGDQIADVPAYVRLVNPSAPERAVMRRSLLASSLEIIERNSRLRDRLAFFELGPVFLPVEGQTYPQEPRKLVISMTGKRTAPAWDLAASGEMDFFDLKGVLENLLEALHLENVSYEPVEHVSLHPGKCAQVKVGEQVVAVFGELHPRVKANYDFMSPAVLTAEIDVEALLPLIPERFITSAVSIFPPVLEDIAVVVDEGVPAGKVESLIRQTGGKQLADVRLFDVFRSVQIGEGKKSLAYSMTYQSFDHTFSAGEATALRNKIVRRLERELGAVLRS